MAGLDRLALRDSLANGMARRYKAGSSLPRHVDAGQKLWTLHSTDLHRQMSQVVWLVPG